MEFAVGPRAVEVEVVANDVSLRDVVRSKVSLSHGREDKEDPFYVVDVGRLLDLHCEWQAALPSVKPFYAVKCNDDPVLLSTLAAMGLGFDCASKNEIKTMLDLGVSPDCIIYANPCKQTSHLKYAAKRGVALMTFDNKMELRKVKQYFPAARLVLRIRADDPDALCQLGMKFGCSVSEGCSLLATARELDLEVVGVSFHVGSGSQSPGAYQSALEMAAEVFLHAASLGFQLTLLDIGGGYPGSRGSREVFERVASAVRASLEELFSRYPHLTVIAEPGRYFACSTHALAVNVISKRCVSSQPKAPTGPVDPDSLAPTDPHGTAVPDSSSFMYYVNDGVYGSFNCILYDHVTPSPSALEAPPSPTAPLYPSSVWGPTCDGLDKICDARLCEQEVGDWLLFDDMGAYTVAAASTFNGFLRPRAYYYVREDKCEQLKTLVCSDFSSPVTSVTGIAAAASEESLFARRVSLTYSVHAVVKGLVEVY